ncbi:MAG TPA: aminopeptidase [Candidatus Saccharimonadia bacterium]|nr:aminopeptidase [Candidatus Saccharimonadia bacterium]
MIDQRDTKLGHILADYSIKTKPGDKVWLRVSSHSGIPLARETYKALIEAGAIVHVDIGEETFGKYLLDHGSAQQLNAPPTVTMYAAEWCDKSIAIYADENTRELAQADSKKMLIRAKLSRPIRDIVGKKPWVLTYYPTHAMAIEANMSYEDFQDFFYNACLRDWKKEYARMKKLADMMTDAKKIEVIGFRTHLTLSAKGRLFVPCAGEYNMPDGEAFTAPVDDSVEGEVYFNFPLLRQGKMIRDIHLWFEKGKVVKATASENQDFLNKILDTDAGARRLGEFAVGGNPRIKNYMYNVLFDEKIEGTVHMALGEAYEECKGINKSTIHMDIVKDMNPKGSSVIADGKVVLKDGKLAV